MRRRCAGVGLRADLRRQQPQRRLPAAVDDACRVEHVHAVDAAERQPAVAQRRGRAAVEFQVLQAVGESVTAQGAGARRVAQQAAIGAHPESLPAVAGQAEHHRQRLALQRRRTAAGENARRRRRRHRCGSGRRGCRPRSHRPGPATTRGPGCRRGRPVLGCCWKCRKRPLRGSNRSSPWPVPIQTRPARSTSSACTVGCDSPRGSPSTIAGCARTLPSPGVEMDQSGVVAAQPQGAVGADGDAAQVGRGDARGSRTGCSAGVSRVQPEQADRGRHPRLAVAAVGECHRPAVARRSPASPATAR